MLKDADIVLPETNEITAERNQILLNNSVLRDFFQLCKNMSSFGQNSTSKSEAPVNKLDNLDLIIEEVATNSNEPVESKVVTRKSTRKR